MTIEDSCISVQ